MSVYQTTAWNRAWLPPLNQLFRKLCVLSADATRFTVQLRLSAKRLCSHFVRIFSDTRSLALEVPNFVVFRLNILLFSWLDAIHTAQNITTQQLTCNRPPHSNARYYYYIKLHVLFQIHESLTSSAVKICYLGFWNLVNRLV